MSTTWNIYRANDLHSSDSIRAGDLVAEPIGDGWTAVYRVAGVVDGRRYPNKIVGLIAEDLSAERLQAVRCREKGEPRDDYDAFVRSALGLLDDHDPAVPRMEACVAL